ncbi:hypothetical protein [Zavarzinella formosa]|uniref:hypothetical protein n=1 Tax=Zavarzinella formosa TaxID=360055 RepID=UPI0002DC78E5|nr:hypothetical protein [Zavarzinella formosa]
MAENFSREQLFAYLDDDLDDALTAAIEKCLRESAEFRHRLDKLREDRDRGEHSIGAVWRRERLSCLTREQLTGHLHGILEPSLSAYADFHLKTVACPVCMANREDLREKQAEAGAGSKRRRRYFETSAGLLNDPKK